MHERTRRFLCRLGFWLLCVLPTLSLAAWSYVLHSPAYFAAERRAWERHLSEQLGLRVTLQKVTHPTSGMDLLEGLELVDPETAARVAQVRRVEISRPRGELSVLASQPELQGDQIWRLWEAIHERILRSQQAAQLRFRCQAGEVTVHRADESGAATLTDVACWLWPTADGPTLALEFRDAALQMAEPAKLHVTRDRRQSPPATRWELQTRETALPCSLLAEHVKILNQLGSRATFQGTVEVTQTANGWQGQLSGRFSEVELDRVISDNFDHKLSGLADITLQRATFQGSKVVAAAGDVASRGGQVSWSLLDQADRYLGLSAVERVRAVGTDLYVRYRELRFSFTLDTQGLKFVGRCGQADEGVVLTDQAGPLLLDKPQEVAPVALARFLSPKNGEPVPATAEAYQLLHILPIPSRTEQPAGNTARRPSSPLRLRQ